MTSICVCPIPLIPVSENTFGVFPAFNSTFESKMFLALNALIFLWNMLRNGVNNCYFLKISSNFRLQLNFEQNSVKILLEIFNEFHKARSNFLSVID